MDRVTLASKGRRGKKNLVRKLDAQQIDDRLFTLVEGRKLDARRAAIDGKSANTIGTAHVEHICVLVELQAALLTLYAICDILPVGGAV